MEKKLKVKYSTFVSPLSYNEWAKQYKVSSMYEESTPYYTGNLTTLEPMNKSSLYQSVEDMFPRISIVQSFINKLKKQKRCLEKTN
jgi:hypothetical protein